MINREPEVRFRHRAVRDLAWVIASPGLLRSSGPARVSDHWCRIAYLDRLPWLRHLDRHPGELEAWLAGHPGEQLGHYFESLIAFWLQQWPRVKMQASRLPVKGVDRVLGEFDFLFLDRHTGDTVHWECAVKFYLRKVVARDGYEWLGPNPRDTLARKCRKVFDSQLKLSARPEAQALLAERGIALPVAQAFIKGYLFYPAAGQWRESQPVPADASPQHLRGWWCHADALESLPGDVAESRWVELQRRQWLSPVLEHDPAPGFTRAALLEWLTDHFRASDRPVLLARLQRGAGGLWRECDRGFVVSAHWPHDSDTIPPHE